jgi:hypothetical protein
MEIWFFIMGLVSPVSFIVGALFGARFFGKLDPTPKPKEQEEETPEELQRRNKLARDFQDMLSYDIADAYKPKVRR